MRNVCGIGVLAICSLLLGCTTVPETHRTRLNIVSDERLIAEANSHTSALLSRWQSENRIVQERESPQAAALVRMVQRVTDKIIDAAGMKGKRNWRVHVVKAREANAMVAPNGEIFIFTGLMPIAANEAGLAAIIGHEVAHVVAAHAAERISQVLLAEKGLEVIDRILEKKYPKHRPAVTSAMGLGIKFGVLLPFSREHELEADRLGMIYMARAGYDPGEAAKVWERMEQKFGKTPWEFLSTHPSNETRQVKLKEFEIEARRHLAGVSRDRDFPLNVRRVEASTSTGTEKSYPIAFSPTLKDGFWYSTRIQGNQSVATFKVTRDLNCAKQVCVTIKDSRGVGAELDKSLATIVTTGSEGDWTRYEPALRQVRFPLVVGESWSDQVGISRSDGTSEAASFAFVVKSYESISISSGEFMAYRIQASRGGQLVREGWYAPETGTFVRVDIFERGSLSARVELVDYERDVDISGGL